eukprot:1662916-Prorocentrum_lima.AAC.1
MSPYLLVGTLPTVPALPIRRSFRIELGLISQLARLAHDGGDVVLRQGRYGHSHCLLYTSPSPRDSTSS